MGAYRQIGEIYTKCLFIYIFRNSPTGQPSRRIVARDGANDGVSRKGVLFGGQKILN